MENSLGESFCSQLCQHPTCWQAQRLEEKGLFRPEKPSQTETCYQDLPTQKIVNMNSWLDKSSFCSSTSKLTSSVQRFLDRSASVNHSKQNQPVSQVQKLTIQNLDADNLINDGNERKKFYVWVPNNLETTRDSIKVSQTGPVAGKVAVTTISMNTPDVAKSYPQNGIENSPRNVKLHQKAWLNRRSLLQGSKGNSPKTDEGSLSSPFLGGSVSSSINGSATHFRSIHQPFCDVKFPNDAISKKQQKNVMTAQSKQYLPQVDRKAVKRSLVSPDLPNKLIYSSVVLDPKLEINKEKQQMLLKDRKGAIQEPDSAEDDLDFLDAQQWFKVEASNPSIAQYIRRESLSPHGLAQAMNNSRPTSWKKASKPSDKREIFGPGFSQYKPGDLPHLASTPALTSNSPLQPTEARPVSIIPLCEMAHHSTSSFISRQMSPVETKRRSEHRVISTQSPCTSPAGYITGKKSDKDQDDESPFTTPSPEFKLAYEYSDRNKCLVLTAARKMKIIASLPADIKTERINSTPGPALSSNDHSCDNTKEKHVTRIPTKTTSNALEEERKGISSFASTSLRDTQSQQHEDDGTKDVEKLASIIVINILKQACCLLEHTGYCKQNKSDKSDDSVLFASSPGKTTENISPDQKTSKSARSKVNSLVNDNRSRLSAFEQPNDLDLFDATEANFIQELQEEYDKL